MVFGIYQYVIDFAGAGATVPIVGFGANLAKGAIKGVKEMGLLGAFTGGIKAAARRYCCCCVLPDILRLWSLRLK